MTGAMKTHNPEAMAPEAGGKTLCPPLPEIRIEGGKIVIKETIPMDDGTTRKFFADLPDIQGLDLSGILEADKPQEVPDGHKEEGGLKNEGDRKAEG